MTLLNSKALKLQHWYFAQKTKEVLVSSARQDLNEESFCTPKRKPNSTWADALSVASNERSSSASSYDAPRAPIKKSQKVTLGRLLLLDRQARQNCLKKTGDQKETMGSNERLMLLNFSNELESFNNSMIEETDLARSNSHVASDLTPSSRKKISSPLTGGRNN